ncbi:tetratricopeptide repeat protein [Bacteroides caecigallinarum]|uniref:tetratricopeptide repeat protein n=1 Tax=Bacteroides caecigallinarum TaxID=1411144 RepID=UPI00195BBF3C|nr:tetratricopeptide repeat protein [Bacteroides caecigallinarum]MBM6864761.1 tetratricopeptide repeat protein [Bacteroides caecigallinarum]MBU3809813.1 tetratricopeptide repeat protein [Candidatus Phocaeicola faecipullorum]
MRYIYLLLLFITLFTSCGTLKNKKSHARDAAVELKDPLTYEQRRKFDYYFLEAVRMKQKGDYDAAFQLYTHCLDIYPQSAAVLYEISQFYMFLGQEAKGEEALKQAVRSDDTNFWYKQTLASYYQSKQDWVKAISVYEDMAQIFPSRLEPLLSLADLYSRTKSYDSLVTTLNRIEELDGKSEQISMEKFRAYLQLENMDKAFSEIQALVDEYPYDMRYRTVLGDVYMSNNRYDEALKVYQDILKEEPDYAPAMVSLATYYQKTGQDSLYNVQLDSILVNENVDTKLKLEFMRQQILKSEQTDKDSTKIISLFETILTKKQPNADVPMLYAQYLITKKMQKESVPVLNKVLELDPENKPARLQLLSYAINENNLDEVIRVATPAIVYNPDAMEFYYYLGLAHYQKDQTDKALEVFKKGVQQINEKSDKGIASDFYSILGDLYHSREMKAEAYAAYDSSLVYNPKNINTLNNYAYYLSVERVNLDKAEEMSFITVKAEPENSTYLDTYAWILFEKGRYTEARIYIEQAMENGGDTSQVIVEHCGDIYFKLGDKGKAVEYWKKALSLDSAPDDGTPPRPEKEIKRLKQKIALRKYIE